MPLQYTLEHCSLIHLLLLLFLFPCMCSWPRSFPVSRCFRFFFFNEKYYHRELNVADQYFVLSDLLHTQINHSFILSWCGRCLIGIRHYQTRDIQPLDHMARGCPTTFKFQHGHHAYRQQEVGFCIFAIHHLRIDTTDWLIDWLMYPSNTLTRTVIWTHAVKWRKRRVKHSPVNMALSSWKHRRVRLPMLRRPSSTPPKRSTRKSKKACSTSTTK